VIQRCQRFSGQTTAGIAVGASAIGSGEGVLACARAREVIAWASVAAQRSIVDISHRQNLMIKTTVQQMRVLIAVS
jgi:hypothetical protein